MNEYQKKLLLQSWIASKIAYNEELDENEKNQPLIKEYAINNLKFDHGIEKIISSKNYTNNTELRNLSKKILSKHVICECSNNRLIVALTIIKPEDKEKENNFVVDFFANIEDSSSTIFEYKELDSINKCISYHGSLIPIDHLIDKLIDGYELVFTGYSFGAALSAFLAIRVLLTKREDVEKVHLDRVSFIGFGCPLFINEKFQTFIENRQLEEKFYFYRHENDFNVNFFDLNAAILKKLGSNFSESERMNFMIAELNQSKSSVSYHPFKLNKDNRELFTRYLKTVEQYLGNQYFSNSEFKQHPFVRFGQNLTISSTGNISELNRDEKYYEYFNIVKLKSKIESLESYNFNINGYFNVKEQNTVNISCFEGFKIGINEMQYECYPTYSSNRENLDDDNNNNNNNNENIFTVAIIKSKNGDNDVFLGIYKSKPSKSYLKTIIGPIMYIGNDDGLVYSDYREHLKTIWYKFKPMKKLTMDDIHMIRFNLYTFYEEIEIKAIEPPEIVTKIELESAFNFEDKKICTYEMALDLLYIHAFFFIYLVKKSGENKGWIFDNCTNVLGNFDRLNKALNDGFKVFEDDQKENEFIKQMYDERFNIGKKDYDIKEFPKFEKNKTFLSELENVMDMKKQLIKLLPKFFYMKLAIVSLVNNPKLLWTCLTNVSDKYNELEIFELFRRAMWYFKVDQEADLKYIYGVKELEKNIPEDKNQFQYLGFYEQIIRNNKEKLEGKEIQEQLAQLFVNNKIFLDSVVSNFNIREALDSSCLVGIVGLKKAGKSTFTDFMLKERRNLGSALNETKEMSAYRFANDIDMLLVDYPHHNSTDEFYSTQFEFSKYLLDYSFVVCDTEQIGDTMTEDLVNLFGALNGLGVNRYCVIMNKFDRLINDFETTEKHFLANEINMYLHEKKNLIVSKLEEFDRKKHFQTNRDELKKNLMILPTCLNINLTESSEQYKYQKAGIWCGENLKRKLLATIADNLRTVQNQDVDVKTNLKRYYETLNVKKCTFITKLNIKQKIKYKTVEIDIDKKNDKFEDIVDTIRISLNGIGDLFCIKPETLSTRYRKLDIDKIKEDTTSLSLSGIDSTSFCINPELVNTRNRKLYIDIKKENELIATISISSNGIDDSYCIKPETLSAQKTKESVIVTRYRKLDIDKNKGDDNLKDTTSISLLGIDSRSFCINPELVNTRNRKLDIDIKNENELIATISISSNGIDDSYCINPSSKLITSIDRFFDNDGFVFIVEKNNQKECAFEMGQDSKLKPLEKTINIDSKFNDLQQEIREHFKIESLKTFWIKPKISLHICEPITSTDGFFNSTGFTYIIEIYKKCFFKMDKNETLTLPITKTLQFDKLKEEIMEHFKIKNIKWVRIIETPETIIRSVFDLFVSTESNFIVENSEQQNQNMTDNAKKAEDNKS